MEAAGSVWPTWSMKTLDRSSVLVFKFKCFIKKNSHKNFSARYFWQQSFHPKFPSKHIFHFPTKFMYPTMAHTPDQYIDSNQASSTRSALARGRPLQIVRLESVSVKTSLGSTMTAARPGGFLICCLHCFCCCHRPIREWVMPLKVKSTKGLTCFIQYPQVL